MVSSALSYDAVKELHLEKSYFYVLMQFIMWEYSYLLRFCYVMLCYAYVMFIKFLKV